MPDSPTEWTVEINADTSGMRQSLLDMNRLGEQFAGRLTNAFEQIAIKGKGLDSVMRSLALSLSKLALNAALKPLEQAIGSTFSGAFGFTKGGVPSGSGLTAFANGGVISSPVMFPIGKNLGLAGEAGPEAILPLARGADGRLGVRTNGGSSAAAVTINFHVSSPDAAGFLRSESQIAAMLNRAVGKGQRNL